MCIFLSVDNRWFLRWKRCRLDRNSEEVVDVAMAIVLLRPVVST
jgi:hypothetical protein